MGVDDVRQQLTELKGSVDALTASVGEVQSGLTDVKREQIRSAESHKKLHQETSQLHDEHQILVSRLGDQEAQFAVHLRDYERQQEHNNIVHAHMTGATLAVRDELKEFRGEFKTHDRDESQDRKNALAAQQKINSSLKLTFMTVLIAGAGLFLTMLGLLITVWSQAQ